MGCTQSKAAVVETANHKAAPIKRSSAPHNTNPAEEPELTATRTVSSDEHDVSAVGNGKSQEEPPAAQPASCTEESSSAAFTMEGNVSAEVEAPAAKVPQSPKSPRRRRRRSLSGGITAMQELSIQLAMEEETEAVNKQVMVESPLQPVISKMVVAPIVSEAETEEDIVVKEADASAEGNDETPAEDKIVIKVEAPAPLEETSSDKIKDTKKEEESKSVEVVKMNKSDGDVAAPPTPKAKSILPEQACTPPKKGKACAGCDATETKPGLFKVCAKCKVVCYCGRDCQVKHWKQHKKVCGSIESWGLSPSNVSPDSKEVLNESTASSIHEDAVRELEAVLRRLRSEDPELSDAQEDKGSEGDDALKQTEPEPQVSDPVEEARGTAGGVEAVVDENLAPTSPRLFDENSPILLPEVRRCAGCQTEETGSASFKPCAKCRCALYCGRSCQKSHWKLHKKVCCKTDSRKNLLVSKDTSLNPIQG